VSCLDTEFLCFVADCLDDFLPICALDGVVVGVPGDAKDLEMKERNLVETAGRLEMR
jgi:hypothetical protein